ncbi:MAG: efflux RND transporter periplasmic adaptor subunit [Balneolales bacterium]
MTFLERIHFILILFLVVTIVSCNQDTNETGQEESATPIAGYELSPRDMSRVVHVSSTIEPENEITIASRISGLITTLNVREGDRVNSGDILIQFDMEEQRAELERARAEMELEETRYNRVAQLHERDAISPAEYEEARANYKMAESEVKLRDTRLGFGTVRAPEDLVVLNRYVERGDAVSVNAPLFRVADLSRLVVRTGIPERDVVHMREGQIAEMHIDAFPDTTFSGTVQRIFPSADTDSRLIRVEILLTAGQQDEVIRPGYLARVRLNADRRENVLAVPSESLLASIQDETFVYVINSENRLERRDVVPGIERRNWTQVLNGLEEGDVIVGGNPGNLRENLYVEVSRWIHDESPETISRW